jgi:transglutaminase-like putative cysteine protease
LFNRLQPREGWAILILAWAAVFSLPAAAVDAGMIVGLQPTLWLTTLGLLTGWWLGHRGSRLTGPLAAPLALLAGVFADLAWGVHVLRVGPLFSQGKRWLDWWRLCGVDPECLLPAPALTYFGEQGAALANFGQRMSWWLNGLIVGQGVADNLVLVAGAGLIAWCVGAWAGWWIGRYGRPFVALLPAGILLTQQVYAADAGYAWLLSFLGPVTLLLVLLRYYRLAHDWEESGTDYSPEVGLDMAGVGLAITAAVLVISPLLPSLSPQKISEAFWRIFREPYRTVEERLTQSFPGVQAGRSLVPPTGVAVGGLPRAHLLGGRPELGREVALRVWPRGARPGDLLYWRGQTFARYTGRGWEEDAAAGKGGHVEQSFPAGAPWTDAGADQGRHPVLSAVEVVKASRAVLYAAGEPVSADRPYRASLRAPGELIALSAAGLPERYNVLGQLSDLDPNLLRAAGAVYPSQIISLYLNLPPDLPEELMTYTAEITAGAPTPYDAAIAIESALRQIKYTLDVPTPPAGRELTSWFLFDLKRGYCDYFATAMALLARLAGIPSRLAVGYGTGTYDARTGGYEVTELQAHSWPELYFPGYGWVPFEPTSGQPLPERQASAQAPLPPWDIHGRYWPADLDAGLWELQQMATVQAATEARMGWVQRIFAALNGLLAAWTFVVVLVGWSRRPAPGTGGTAAGWYDRLARWGGRLGRPLRPTDTAREYAAAVAQAAETVAGRARLGRRHALSAALTVRADAPRLAQTFERILYGPEENQTLRVGKNLVRGVTETRRACPEPVEGVSAALWVALWRLWLARWGI